MINTLHLVSQILLLLGILFMIIFSIYSVVERENRALKRAILLTIVLVLVLGINHFVIISYWIQLPGVVLILIFFVVVLLRFGNRKIVFEHSGKRYDERDIMFSRMELEEGTKKFDEYYKSHPHNKPKDDLFRKEPGLLSPDSKFYNPLLFNAAKTTFATVDLLQPLVETQTKHINAQKVETGGIAVFLKNWTIKLGAADIGFTLVKPHHVYSHVGRRKEYGTEVDLSHKYAIAFTVEMNHESLSYTPKGPIIMESAQQYLNAGTIAVQIAQFIRNLGFDARAHIDANYRVICPIVAQDAGLGVIGRMGLLMTPKLGPRVRIGVITTELELPVDKGSEDLTAVQFCEICKKCATNCPSSAISNNSGKENDKWIPWKIDQEKCFTYWCKAGTDCGRCVTVCPYSHPNNAIHNTIRWAIKQNSFNRWLALKLDDFFYGRKPLLNQLRDWMSLKES